MTTEVPAVIQTSARDLGQVARRYLTGWRGLIVLAIVVLAAGLALGWGWLVAAGIAPLLISVLPCLAMCALGLCMNRRGGRSCSVEDTSSKTIDTAVEAAPPPKTLEVQPDLSRIGSQAVSTKGE
jgi:hypothetical protein